MEIDWLWSYTINRKIKKENCNNYSSSPFIAITLSYFVSPYEEHIRGPEAGLAPVALAVTVNVPAPNTVLEVTVQAALPPALMEATVPEVPAEVPAALLAAQVTVPELAVPSLATVKIMAVVLQVASLMLRTTAVCPANVPDM